MPWSSFSICFRGAKPLCPLKQKEKENINECAGSLVPEQISRSSQSLPSLGRLSDLEMPQGTKASCNTSQPRTKSATALHTQQHPTGFASFQGPWQRSGLQFVQTSGEMPSCRISRSEIPPSGCWLGGNNLPACPWGDAQPACAAVGPCCIGSSHGPANHSFLGMVLAWGCVTSPLPGPSVEAAMAPCQAPHFAQHPTMWLVGGPKPGCPQNRCLLPSMGRQAVV